MEIIVDKTLGIHPAYQVREDWPGLVGSFDGAGSTGGTAHTPGVPHSVLMLLRRHQAATKRTFRVFALVLLAELCAPVIYQELTHQRLAAVVTTRSYLVAIALDVIGPSFVNLELSITDGSSTASAHKML